MAAAVYCSGAVLWRRVPSLFIDLPAFVELFREANSARAGTRGKGARSYSPSPGRTVQMLYR